MCSVASKNVAQVFRRYVSVTNTWYNVRTVYNVSGTFDKHLEADTLKNVEEYWKPRLKDMLPKVG